MKLTAERVDVFLRRPDPAVRGVLIYGPDRGLVRERADALCLAVTGDLTDPFRVCEMGAAALKDDPALLVDEMASLSLSGGTRVVRLAEATDAMAKPVEAALAGAPAGSLLVAAAGDLAKRSALRSLFETAANAAAIACYSDDDAGVKRVIASMLAEAGLSATAEASAYLAVSLGGGDRAMTRGEIEKLIVYMGGSGGSPGGAGTVGIDEAMACVGDNREASLDAVAMATGAGDLAALDQAVGVAFASDVQPVSLIRAVGRHFQRLHLAVGAIAAGRSVGQAMATLRPPVFYKLRDSFASQLRAWTPERLAAALRLLIETELDCKITGAPAEALCMRTLWRIAAMSRHGR